jgi:hypothetical protein
MIDTNILDSLCLGEFILIPSFSKVVLSLVLILNVVKGITIIFLRKLEDDLLLGFGLLVIRVDQHVLMLVSHIIILPILTILVITFEAQWRVYLVSLDDNLLVFVLQERPGFFIVNVESLVSSIVSHSLLSDVLKDLHWTLEPVRTLR